MSYLLTNLIIIYLAGKFSSSSIERFTWILYNTPWKWSILNIGHSLSEFSAISLLKKLAGESQFQTYSPITWCLLVNVGLSWRTWWSVVSWKIASWITRWAKLYVPWFFSGICCNWRFFFHHLDGKNGNCSSLIFASSWWV